MTGVRGLCPLTFCFLFSGSQSRVTLESLQSSENPQWPAPPAEILVDRVYSEWSLGTKQAGKG